MVYKHINILSCLVLFILSYDNKKNYTNWVKMRLGYSLSAREARFMTVTSYCSPKAPIGVARRREAGGHVPPKFGHFFLATIM